MRLLVTGADGLLGSELTPRLRERGHTVVTCSRSRGDLRADLSDAGAARKALGVARPEVIVNLAALTDVDACERDPDAAYRLNTRIVENLAAWIEESGTGTHLVQLSTDQVYDGAGPHREADVRIVNIYGFSKYAGELAAIRVPSTVMRTNLFGQSRTAERSSLTDWLFGALRAGQEITVFDDVLFSPLTMTRLSDFIALAVERRIPGVFNVGSSNGMSKADFAFAFAKTVGLPTTSVRRGRSVDRRLAARRPTDMRLDSTRFATAFGVMLPSLQSEIESTRGDYLS